MIDSESNQCQASQTTWHGKQDNHDHVITANVLDER